MNTHSKTRLKDTPKIEFLFDFGSPNAYLVHKVIPSIAATTGIEFDYVPILLGGVFKATNNVSPMVALKGIKNKPEYQQLETQRFCTAHTIKLYTPNPHFPVNTLKLMRAAVFCRDKSYYAQYIDTIYDAMWEQALKMDEDEVIQQVLLAAGLNTTEIIEGMSMATVKEGLIQNTEAAVNRGVFGSPTFFVNDHIYFGKDKLRDAVEQALNLN